MLATEHATTNPPRLLECLHRLAEIVERGDLGVAERRRVNPPHLEREAISLSENSSRHGDRFAQQRFGFFEALFIIKGRRKVAGCREGQ